MPQFIHLLSFRIASRYLLLPLLLVLALLCPDGFASSAPLTTRPIIDLDMLQGWLAARDPNLVIVDVRDVDAYKLGHIPGAINIPVELTFSQRGDHSRIATLQHIREILSRAGVRNTDHVVLYDDGMLRNAAHEFWVLETYGHKRISVLDGGLAVWTTHAGKLSETVNKRPRSNYIPNIAAHRLSTELSTLLAIKNRHVTIIDARGRDEYLGKTSRARRKGHIPNAISIPWNKNLEQQSTIPLVKSKPALQALYSGLGKDDNVITYCNRGKESAVTYLVLRNLGYKVSVYDGAWLEWGNDDNLPIETGETARGGTEHGR